MLPFLLSDTCKSKIAPCESSLCFTLLHSNNVKADYIVTDRHTQVQNFLRERGVTQYYDVWHLEKGNYERHLYEMNFV